MYWVPNKLSNIYNYWYIYKMIFNSWYYLYFLIHYFDLMAAYYTENYNLNYNKGKLTFFLNSNKCNKFISQLLNFPLDAHVDNYASGIKCIYTAITELLINKYTRVKKLRFFIIVFVNSQRVNLDDVSSCSCDEHSFSINEYYNKSNHLINLI